VRHDCIEPLGPTTTEAAEALGMTPQTFNNLVNGKKRYFGGNGDPSRRAFRNLAAAADGR
jgi:hypothetical protein